MNTRSKNGITLLALIITIIVLLILAGVSINALTGDNGVITNSMRSKVATEIASYKEEMEMSTIGINNQDDNKSESGMRTITAFGNIVCKYISSLRENDIGNYAIIDSELWYLGDDETIRDIASSQKIHVLPDGVTKNEYLDELEELAILAVIKSEGSDILNKKDETGNMTQIGESLKDKELNSIDWKLVTEVVDNELKGVYGTGWTYVPAGETIEGLGTLNNAYIINFNERKAVRYNTEKHAIIDIDTFVVAKNNLIFNADPSVMDKYNQSVANNQEFNISELGDGISFYGYNDSNGNVDLTKAFTNSSFEFDGVDDYIKIQYNDSIKKQILAQNGFTFQFYGIMRGGKAYELNGDLESPDCGKRGFFGYTNSLRSNTMAFRVIRNGNNDFLWNAGYGTYSSDFDNVSSSVWNQRITYNNIVKTGVVTNFTFKLDLNDSYKKGNETYYTQSLFVNGEKTSVTGGYNKAEWDYFIENYLNDCDTFIMGKADYHHREYWHFSKLSCYSMKLYNIALTDEQILESYKKDVAYHQFLENGGIATTQEGTGVENY